jgi:hypothetical protein
LCSCIDLFCALTSLKYQSCLLLNLHKTRNLFLLKHCKNTQHVEAIFFFCCSFSNTMLLCREAASQEQRATRWMELLEMILNNVMQGRRNARSRSCSPLMANAAPPPFQAAISDSCIQIHKEIHLALARCGLYLMLTTKRNYTLSISFEALSSH